MLNLKKTALAVLALSSSAVFAGTMGPVCSAVNVTVPCETTAWDFGGKALYLQPTLNGNTATMSRTLTNGAGDTLATFGQNPPYSWGFFLEGSYHFNTGNDLNLNWYEVNRSTNKTFATAIPDTSGPLNIDATYGAGTVNLNPNWNAVNLELGQHVDFGEGKSIRFHGGAQYARLTSSSTFTVAGTDAAETTFSTVVTAKPTYNGFGPRVGADMVYGWGNGLGIYANGAAALLAGSSKFTNNYYAVRSAAPTTVNFSVTGSSTMVVPVLDAKLGATYTYAMAQGDLTLDAGWMWVNYFNVQQSTVTGLSPANNDFGLQGPFVGLKWMGNIV